MPTSIADLLLSAVRLATLLGVTTAQSVNWVLNFKTAPAGVPQDLWELGLRSLIQHLTEPHLHKAYILTLVDYRINADSNRLWTIDLRTKTILVATLVGHGSGTGGSQNPREQCRFVGNLPGSELSSAGGFVTEMNTRPSRAGSIGRSVVRTALAVEGLDSTNDQAYRRRILFHGAHYVTQTRAGRSDGCFATEQTVNDRLIPIIVGGSFVFSHF